MFSTKINAGWKLIQQNYEKKLAEYLAAKSKDMYSANYLAEKRKNLIDEMVNSKHLVFSEIYDRQIKKGLDQIKDSYTKELTPDEFNKKAFDLHQAEIEYKSMSLKELEIIAEDYTAKGDLTAEHVNIVASELRTRGAQDQADYMRTAAKDMFNFKEPWKSDPEYKQLKQSQKELEHFQVDQSFYFDVDQRIPTIKTKDELFI